VQAEMAPVASQTKPTNLLHPGSRFAGEVDLFLRATAARPGAALTAIPAQGPTRHEAAANAVADHHAMLASSLLEAVEAVLFQAQALAQAPVKAHLV
jgi:hypothetical protein